MKLKLFGALILSICLFPGFQCQKDTEPTTSCYKGRLEIKGICMNYTIKLLEGAMDPNLIERSWKDETTGITYENVFKLGSICTFPAGIKQGDEFYFTIDKTPNRGDCVVCMAYYPTPAKALSIVVSETPCQLQR
jgi:hypothetical protein